jgi:hypothetical protein
MTSKRRSSDKQPQTGTAGSSREEKFTKKRRTAWLGAE